jgi:integrase
MAKERSGLFLRKGVWYLRTDPVTGQKRSTGCRSKAAAKAYRNQRELAAADPTYAAAESSTLGEWIVKLLQAKKTDRSEATLLIYRQKLGHFVRLWGPSMRLVDINTGVCDEYVATRRSEKVTDHTIVKEFNCLNQLLKLATRAGCYGGQIGMLRPLDVAPHYEPRKRALPPAEVDRLLKECKPRLWAFVAVTVALGTRLSETLKFRSEDVDTKTWIANIKRTKTKKGTKVIPVLPPFRGFILRALDELPITKYNNLRRDLAAACQRAGIAKCTPNDLRRSQGTMLVEAGVTLDVIRRLLGHETTRMVEMVYGQPRPEALAELAAPHLTNLAFLESGASRLSDRQVQYPQQGSHTVYSRATIVLMEAYADVMSARKAA